MQKVSRAVVVGVSGDNVRVDKTKVRPLFPVTRNLTYLNHAAVGPLSTRACEAMERQARDQRDFGALHWRAWDRELDETRVAAAKLLGAETAEVVILKNTSEGLSFVAEGYRWQGGENVVTTAIEFPSNVAPWKNLARRGVELRVARSQAVDAIEPLIDARTRIVTVASVAFHNGAVADLEAIGELCAAKGVLFCVDAIQSFGALPVDVRRAKISFLAADAHKWVCGPEGAATFFVAAEHLERIEVLEYGWTNIVRHGSFLDAAPIPLPDARRFQGGSPNTTGVCGLHAALDLIHENGIESIAAEVVRLATLLADRLDGAGFRVGSPRPIRSGIVGAVVEDGRELLRLHAALEKEGIVCSPREGMLRFATHYFNDEAEIERAVDVLRAVSKR